MSEGPTQEEWDNYKARNRASYANGSDVTLWIIIITVLLAAPLYAIGWFIALPIMAIVCIVRAIHNRKEH